MAWRENNWNEYMIPSLSFELEWYENRRKIGDSSVNLGNCTITIAQLFDMQNKAQNGKMIVEKKQQKNQRIYDFLLGLPKCGSR